MTPTSPNHSGAGYFVNEVENTLEALNGAINCIYCLTLTRQEWVSE